MVMMFTVWAHEENKTAEKKRNYPTQKWGKVCNALARTDFQSLTTQVALKAERPESILQICPLSTRVVRFVTNISEPQFPVPLLEPSV